MLFFLECDDWLWLVNYSLLSLMIITFVFCSYYTLLLLLPLLLHIGDISNLHINRYMHMSDKGQIVFFHGRNHHNHALYSMFWVILMPLMQYLHDLLKPYKYNHTKMNMIHLHFQPSSPPNKRQFCLSGHSSLVSRCCALHLKKQQQKTKENPESLAALLFHRDAEEPH